MADGMTRAVQPCATNATQAAPQTYCNIPVSSHFSPRVREAMRSKWIAFQRVLRANASAYEPAAASHKPRLLLVGDSITEAFRATSVGLPSPFATSAHAEAVRSSALLAAYPEPLILAISGDETQHLLWRLREGGELASPRLVADPHLWISLLIGTNNICHVSNHSAEDTAAGVAMVARLLLERTRGRLLLNALLPRDNLKRRAGRVPGQRAEWPFMPRIDRANAIIEGEVLPSLAAEFGSHRVRHVSCAHHFRGGLGSVFAVNTTLMPDGTHPTPSGSAILADCIHSALTTWRAERGRDYNHERD